jgi:arabinofuranosyltransferase
MCFMRATSASPARSRGRATAAFLVVPGVLMLSVVGGVYASFRPDDLFIYLRFVDHLIRGLGPSFNPGEPTYGFTSVLWLGMLTVTARITGELVVSSRLLSVAFALAALPAMAILARRLGASRAVAWSAALLLALDAWFLRWAATGMESALGVVLLLLGFARHLDEFDAGRGRTASVALFAALALVRPEALALVVLALAEAALPGAPRAAGFSWARRIGGALAVALVILAPWLLFAWWFFGTPLPDTAGAKGIPGAPWWQALASLARIMKLAGISVGVPGLALLIATVVWLRRNGVSPPVRRALLPCCWLVGLPLLYAAAGVVVYSRYLLLWTPLILVAGVVAGRWILGTTPRATAMAFGLLVILAAAPNLWATGWVLGPASRAYSRSMERVNVTLGRWLGENTPPGTVIAVENIGAIGFFSGRRILDMNGLVTPEIIPFKREGRVADYLEEQRPDYIIKIAFEPDPWSREGPDLPMEPLQVLPFEHMFVDQEAPLYYTLYRVGPGASGAGATTP